MVRKKNGKNPVMTYKVYHKGFLVGKLSLTPERVKELERKGFRLVTVNRFGQKIKSNAISRRKPTANPKGLVKIYDHITRIEGTKGKNSAFPGQRFFHNFKRPYPAMYGTPDRKALVIK